MCPYGLIPLHGKYCKASQTALDVCEQQDPAWMICKQRGKNITEKYILHLMITEIILQIHTGNTDSTFFIHSEIAS